MSWYREQHAERSALATRAALASVGVAIVLLALKIWAAWSTHSMAMLGSLADTALDFIASIVTLAGVRIDGPHVANFEHPEGPDPLNRYLVQAAVGAAELMELPVLATGVRTRVQAERLHQLGVELVQGEYSGGVVSASEMAELAAGS